MHLIDQSLSIIQASTHSPTSLTFNSSNCHYVMMLLVTPSKGCCFFLTKLLSAVIQRLLRQLKDLKYLLLVSREQGNSFFFFLVQSIKFYCVLSKSKLEDASYVWVCVCHDGLKEIKKCPHHTSLFKANSRMSLQQLLYSIWIVLQMQREIFGATGKCTSQILAQA